MKTDTIRLGYAVGSGEPVDIPIRHMCVTGQTQEAGKTTALEALIARSGLRAVTFITKRGEQSFAEGRRIQPFFRERADWQFVASLIDATMGEKNKLLRAWLMKVCRNTKTLAEVQHNVATAKAAARGFSESIYTEIEGYLELVVPQLAELPPARAVVIHPWLNVMDLSPYRAELQGLVIRSVIEHVYEHETDVITVIPEAWEFLPEGRGSPVKLAAETLIRKGAALRNYMWVDAQDLGGLWKTVVRAAAVYLVGVQREANEVKRTLSNLPASAPKLNAADVASLGLGQFYACWGRHAIKTYVQPAWMNDKAACDIAAGRAECAGTAAPKKAKPLSAHEFGERFEAAGHAKSKEDSVTNEEARRIEHENELLQEQNARLMERIATLEKRDMKDAARRMPDLPTKRVGEVMRGIGDREKAGTTAPIEGTDALYQLFKARLLDEAPAILKIALDKPQIDITVQRPVLDFEAHSMKWRLVRLAGERFFTEEAKSPSQIRTALKRVGPDCNTANIARAMDDLVKTGVFTDEGTGYRLVPGVDVNVRES